MRGADLRHYDSLVLALKVIDLIIDHTGLDREVDRAMVLQSLAPLLSAMDQAAGVGEDPERHAVMVDKVLGGLRNDPEHRRPFDFAYRDFDEQGQSVLRKLEFRLVADHFHPSGNIVLRLSNEAVNLYLNALELDIEDAQAAAEAVVQSQLARGKFNEAVQSAKNARWQSLRYQDKITNILRETRRDIGRVDWRDEVPRLLGEAIAHIGARLTTEESILKTAEERLDVIEPADEGARAVAEVAHLIRDCRLRHVDLHDQLMRARNVFLDEQARQAFVPTPLRPLPELLSEVLDPVLRLGRMDAVQVVERDFPCFFGAQAPPSLSLAELVEWQLKPRRELPATEVPVGEQDLTTYGAEILRYPREVREQAESILHAIGSPTTLSILLENARKSGASSIVRELLVLLTLQHFAPELEEGPVSVERRRGELLRAAGFYGDEVEISRRETGDGA